MKALCALFLVVLQSECIHSFVCPHHASCLRLVVPSRSPRAVSNDEDLIQATIEQESRQLVDLLVDHAKTKGIHTPNGEIDHMMKTLIGKKVKFDPDTCLSGPLYAVAYQQGPEAPFWVRYSKLAPQGEINLDGQKYTKNKDGTSYNVLNYGEFFGKAVTMRADGVCIETPKPGQDHHDNEEEKNVNGNILSRLVRRIRGKGEILEDHHPPAALVQCPMDYYLNVEHATLRIYENPFELGAGSSGKMRILYADPQVRILAAPQVLILMGQEDSPDNNMEADALLTAQVRVDLLDPTFEKLKTFTP
jgi:hypothetical protein